MNIRRKILELAQVEEDLIAEGYTRQEAIQLIQAAAICQLVECTDKNSKSYMGLSND